MVNFIEKMSFECSGGFHDIGGEDLKGEEFK
jgi:hypothetical protein